MSQNCRSDAFFVIITFRGSDKDWFSSRVIPISKRMTYLKQWVSKSVKERGVLGVVQNCRSVAMFIYHRIQIGSDKYCSHRLTHQIPQRAQNLLISGESMSTCFASKTLTSPPSRISCCTRSSYTFCSSVSSAVFTFGLPSSAFYLSAILPISLEALLVLPLNSGFAW